MADLMLITDRTQSDVDRAKYLSDLGWRGMSESERLEFLSGLRGSYTINDLNRVESAVRFLANLLNEYGYPVDVETYADWTIEDIPMPPDAERYLGNVKALIDAFLVLPSSPAVPDDMDQFTFEEANAIEQILSDIYKLLTNMIADMFFVGEIYAGEDDYI